MFFIKKIVRVLILVGIIVGVFYLQKNKLAEFRDLPVRDRYSHSFYKKTVDCYREILKRAPFATWHYALADSYMDEGLEAQAVGEYKKTIQMDSRSVQAYLALADIYDRRGSFKEAFELLQKAENAILENSEIRNLKNEISHVYFLEAGVKIFDEGDRVKAREWLSKALEAKPDSAHTHYLIALSFGEQQDFQQVEDHLKKAISLDPEHGSARSLLGDIYFGKGDFEAAIGQYQSFLDVHGDNPFVLNNMGLAYMNIEKYGPAIPGLQKALAFDPLNVEIRHNLSAVYRDYGMLDKAAEGFRSIIDMKRDYLNVHNDLGDIYRKQGREQDALKEYEASIEYGQKGLSRGVRDPLRLVELAYAYNETKEYEKAAQLINEALILDRNNQKAYLTLARIYKNSNRPKAALAALNKASQSSSRKYSYVEEAITNLKKEMSQARR